MPITIIRRDLTERGATRRGPPAHLPRARSKTSFGERKQGPDPPPTAPRSGRCARRGDHAGQPPPPPPPGVPVFIGPPGAGSSLPLARRRSTAHAVRLHPHRARWPRPATSRAPPPVPRAGRCRSSANSRRPRGATAHRPHRPARPDPLRQARREMTGHRTGPRRAWVRFASVRFAALRSATSKNAPRRSAAPRSAP